MQLTNKNSFWRIMTTLYFSYLSSLACKVGLLIKQTTKKITLSICSWQVGDSSRVDTFLSSVFSILSQPRTCWMFIRRDWNFKHRRSWSDCFCYVRSSARLRLDDGSTRKTGWRNSLSLSKALMGASHCFWEADLFLALGNDLVWRYITGCSHTQGLITEWQALLCLLGQLWTGLKVMSLEKPGKLEHIWTSLKLLKTLRFERIC